MRAQPFNLMQIDIGRSSLWAGLMLSWRASRRSTAYQLLVGGSILRLTDYVTKHDPKKDFVRQLVVFQDGTVAYSWIREGVLCMR
jgi:hypothetical protein